MIPSRPSQTTKAPRSNRAVPFARSGRARWLLVIMAKVPIMGRVKTRLARQSGASNAIRFYRHASRTVVHRLSADLRWRTVVAITPDTAHGPTEWPRRAGRIGQGRGDLGTRMQRLLELPDADRVLVIGTDIPAITPAHIARAFRLLGNHDAVFGPALDGGFWLAGLKRCPRARRPFTGVRWSAPETLNDTLAHLRDARTASAAILSDVDTGAELQRLGSAASRIVPAIGTRPPEKIAVVQPRRACALEPRGG